ncbi:hypothetical protein [Schlesneria sp. T3-172]|uniref:hypothetical protein n=1 Tax=Schlesneria sphaerica TaxID=3373610 RepID=UPI0037CAE963
MKLPVNATGLRGLWESLSPELCRVGLRGGDCMWCEDRWSDKIDASHLGDVFLA